MSTAQPETTEQQGMSTKRKAILGVILYILLMVALVVFVGSEGKNEEFQPQNEFFLDPWISIDIAGIDFSINKAVFYLILTSACTIRVMTYIANRMQREPNRVQMAVEMSYDLTRKNIASDNLDEKMTLRWFPFLA